MIRTLVTFSLRYRVVILVLACVTIGYGLHVVSRAKLDVFPNFVQPQVEVQTECPGMAPEEVERLVTLPIEMMMSGLGDLETLRSESIQGLSAIMAVFKEGTDVFRARQMLAEMLAESSSRLPSTVQSPRLSPLTSSTMDLLKIGLVSEKLTPMELRTFADWTLKPRLLAVPGVAKCSSYGGEVRQLQVQVRPDRLLAYNLSMSEVLSAARVSTGVIGAGYLETRNQRITLEAQGQAITPEILGEVVVASTNGFSVRLKDVARVVETGAPKFGDASVQGRPGVLLTLSSQYGANTMEVTRALENALEDMKPALAKEEIQIFPRIHRPATFIEVALANMRHSLVVGGILVAVVLFLLLGNVRTSLISLTAIPLSLLAAIMVLDRLGVTINTLTLGGLAIALGEVVDDSIIDVENIFRRLRENFALSQPRPVFQVVLAASLEVRSAVVFATFIVILIFLPVLTLSGLQGSFFSPLALSYILAILASLLVALTVTPALSYLLFERGVPRTGDPALQQWLKQAYCFLLRFVTRWPRVLILLATGLCIVAATRLPFLGGNFLPEFREGHYVLQLTVAPGISLPEMARLGARISEKLLANTNISTVAHQIGRAELGEDTWGPNRSECHVELKRIPGQDQARVADQIREILAEFPGVQSEVVTFLGDRLSETISGEVAPIVVNVFGDDLDLLDAKAAEIAHVLNSVPGHVDVKVKSLPGAPQLAIRLRPERLTRFGFRPVEVLEALATAFQGTVVAQTYEGSQIIQVTVILDPVNRGDPRDVPGLLLSNSAGVRLPLRELAEVYPNSGRPSILHEGGRRRQTVTCGVTGRDVGSFVQEAERSVAAKVKFPPQTYSVFSGTAQAKARAQQELLLHSGVAAVGILLLLATVFRSGRNLLLVLANIPFALVGGVLAVWVSSRLSPENGSLTIGSLVGFVTLFGITMRNSIMMVSHYEHLITLEGCVWGVETALRGASERLMPILMTAAVTGLGLLPLAIGSGEAGREIEGPMAVVILGGLITSTLLNLLVLPTLALRYGRFHPPSASFDQADAVR
jgi:CzcA family heavy metal efflux pump